MALRDWEAFSRPETPRALRDMGKEKLTYEAFVVNVPAIKLRSTLILLRRSTVKRKLLEYSLQQRPVIVNEAHVAY
jgi:hypothetical protein